MYLEKRTTNVADIGSAMKPPSLVDLCVNMAILNVRYLGDVGATDAHLLERILPHCTLDQLMHIEKSTKGRDLSPVTDELWKNFYALNFGGRASVDKVTGKMKKAKVQFTWRQLYEAKLKDFQEAEKETSDRLKELYKKENARKQSRQVQLCTKIPPSSKRSFLGSGPGYNLSNVKSNIMKKAKIDFMNSQEVKNLAAMRKKAVQGRQSGTSITKSSHSSGLCTRTSVSTSKCTKP